MRTKTPDRLTPARVDLDVATYWLEDDLGNRISKLFATRDKPLRLAGRGLENVGSLAGWTLVYRDRKGIRHDVASGPDLEVMATPFMPVRTPSEVEALRPFTEARRSLGFRHANVVTDERVY